jgi:hypothetical protein
MTEHKRHLIEGTIIAGVAGFALYELLKGGTANGVTVVPQSGYAGSVPSYGINSASPGTYAGPAPSYTAVPPGAITVGGNAGNTFNVSGPNIGGTFLASPSSYVPQPSAGVGGDGCGCGCDATLS